MIDIELRRKIRTFVGSKERSIISEIRTSYMCYIDTLKSRERPTLEAPFPIKERYEIVVDNGLHIPIWKGEIKIDRLFLNGTYGICDPIIFNTVIYATFTTHKANDAKIPNYLSMHPAYGVHFIGTPTSFPQICLGDYKLNNKDTGNLNGLKDVGLEVSRLLSGINLNSLGQKYLNREEVNARGDLELLETCEGSVLWVESAVDAGRIKKLL